MIYGYTEDKNRVEVPDKEYVDECLCDTGWITVLEAGTYKPFILSKPLECRKIGNRVHWRTHIESVMTGAPPASQYTFDFMSVPVMCIPIRDVQNTAIVLKYGDANAYILNTYVYTSGEGRFHIYNHNSEAITATELNVGIEFSYLLD